jgi:toxin-antitoxin system PIN domain toxin
MLVDANMLLYAVDRSCPQHEVARDWIVEHLNGARRVGLPWTSLVAFVRISSHPRALRRPLQPEEAVAYVNDWLEADVAWIPEPGPGHAEILTALISKHQLRGNLITDAHLATLAIEHGLALISADSDFARFPEVTWLNPLR